MRVRLSGILLLAAIVTLAACGGGGGGSPASSQPVSKPISVTVLPASAAVEAGATQKFTPAVANAGNTAVTWSVKEADGGTVSTDGTYTAPARTGTFHVIATSQADTSKAATATVVVTAPAVSFASVAPIAASEGNTYTYTATAADRLGSAMSYTWTSVPAGAQTEGAILRWNPTPAQSRTANTVSVTAQSPLGATATQTWTVTPAGTITVRGTDRYTTATGSTEATFRVADELTVSVWTGETQLAAVPQTDGSVKIPNVPAGPFWLSLGNGTWIRTEKNLVDLGTGFLGRAWQTDVAQGVQTLAFNLSGLMPWTAGSSLVLWSPNLTDVTPIAQGLLTDGAAAVAGNETLTLPMIDATQADMAYAMQFSPVSMGSLQAMAATRYFGPITASMTDGGTVPLTGAMQPMPQNSTLSLIANTAAIQAAVDAVHPGKSVTDIFQADLWVQPFFTGRDDEGLGSGSRATLVRVTGSDVAALNTALPWGSPFPAAWKPVFRYDHSVRVHLATDAGEPVQAYGGFGFTTLTPPAAGTQIAPPLPPLTGAQVAGKAFFTNAAALALTPTLQWQAPAGNDISYTVVVSEVVRDGNGALVASDRAFLHTRDTSITLPAGVLAAGSRYVFTVIAWSDPEMRSDASPNRWGYPSAWSFTVSGVMQTQGTATATASATEVAPVRRVRTSRAQ